MKSYFTPTVATIALLLLVIGPIAVQAQEQSVTDTHNSPIAGRGTADPCSCSAGATILLDQAPDLVTAYNTDVAANQSEAEGFVLAEAATINEIRVWGGYFTGNTPITPDNFTVIFHDNAGGVPGANAAPPEALASAACREIAAVGTLFGVDEYVYLLRLATPVSLAAGTYWVEIYNDTTANQGNVWAWESGVEDPVAGVPSHAFASQVPGTSWGLSGSGVSFAAQMCSARLLPTVEPVPTLGQLGLLALMLALIGIGLHQLWLRLRR